MASVSDNRGNASVEDPDESSTATSVKRRRDDTLADADSVSSSPDLDAAAESSTSLLSNETTAGAKTNSIECDCCLRLVSKLPKRETVDDFTERPTSCKSTVLLPFASTIDEFLQAGGPSRYQPRPEWLFQLTPTLESPPEHATLAGAVETRNPPSRLERREKNAVFGKDWDSLLHVAIRTNATESALAIIDIATCPLSRVHVNDGVLEAINAKGVTPLILAAQKGNVSVVRALLVRGVNPALSCFNGNTAALQAAHFGHATVLELLLRGVADQSWEMNKVIIEAANVHHTTPLMRAAQEGHEHAVHVLLSAGALPNRRNRSHMTALMLSAQRGHVNVCRQLIQAGADLNMATDKQQSTALMLACKRGKVDVVRALVTAGCDLWGKNHRGQTAQQMVQQEQRRQVTRTIVSDYPAARLVTLLEPETQVALMRETCRRTRHWECIRAWALLQQDRALVAVGESTGVSMDTALLMFQFQAAASTRPPAPWEHFQNASVQALIRTMTLPAPLVQMIALFLPLPKLWTSRLSMLQSTCLANADVGVTMTLDFIDEVLEESGFLEACSTANVPPPSPFQSWQAWKRSGQRLGATTTSPLMPPLGTLRVTDATNPQPRDRSNPTRVELRRQVGYLPLLAEHVTTLGVDVLTKYPYHLPLVLLQQLVRIADVVSLTRRMQGQGVHFSAQVATDLMLLARRLTWWHDCRERQSDTEAFYQASECTVHSSLPFNH